MTFSNFLYTIWVSVWQKNHSLSEGIAKKDCDNNTGPTRILYQD